MSKYILEKSSFQMEKLDFSLILKIVYFIFRSIYCDDKCLFRPTLGVAKRKCLNGGVWGYPDYGDCTSEEFHQLQEKVLSLKGYFG